MTIFYNRPQNLTATPSDSPPTISLAWDPAESLLLLVEVITETREWVPPNEFFVSALVECVGGGGGGGGGEYSDGATDIAGDGGGGGEYRAGVYTNAELGASQDVAIGTGGAGQAQRIFDSTAGDEARGVGASGTATSFGAFITANPGLGGHTTIIPGQTGGTGGSGGTDNSDGGDGGVGSVSATSTLAPTDSGKGGGGGGGGGGRSTGSPGNAQAGSSGSTDSTPAVGGAAGTQGATNGANTSGGPGGIGTDSDEDLGGGGGGGGGTSPNYAMGVPATSESGAGGDGGGYGGGGGGGGSAMRIGTQPGVLVTVGKGGAGAQGVVKLTYEYPDGVPSDPPDCYDIFRDGVYLTTVCGTTSYDDTDVVPGVVYEYTVAAADGESELSDPASAIIGLGDTTVYGKFAGARDFAPVLVPNIHGARPRIYMPLEDITVRTGK